MADAAAPGVSLLLGLMAAQFGVHAAGWAMAALMQREPAGAEAHFSASWLAAALSLVAHRAGGPWLPAAGDAAMLAAALLVHRGILRFYRQPVPDRLYAGAAAVALLVVGLAVLQAPGEQGRIVACSLLLAGAAAANASAFWRHGRQRTRVLAAAAALGLGAAAIGLAGRAALVLLPLQPHVAASGIAARLDVATTIGLFFLAGLFNLAQLRLVLGRVVARLLAQSQRDALTGVANRRGFMQALDAAHQRALRAEGRYGLLMVDIDHFKRINDEHGHAAGDVALQQVAAQLAHAVRTGDTVGRWGGEEFCLLLPDCDLPGAAGLAERVRAAVAGAGTATVSVGVALVQARSETPEAALKRADAALYRAKAAGRNRVEIS